MTQKSKTTNHSGQPKPRLVFFGNERLATGVSTTAPTLTALIEAGYEVCGVVANFEPGKSRSARKLEIAEVAESNGIPLLLPARPGDIIDELHEFNADIGILVAYGNLVPESIINLFPKGIINIHPSLLPLHRGPTPIESVILNGSSLTGVSIMQLVKAMDAGPVFGQTEQKLLGDETKQLLADKLLELGCNMLLELLPDILSGEVVATAQDASKATYDNKIDKRAGDLDFNKHAQQLEREVRAYAHWPKSRMNLAGIDVIITEARIANLSYPQSDIGEVFIEPSGLIGVKTRDNYLLIERLKPAGKQEMTAQAFLAGYGKGIKKI